MNRIVLISMVSLVFLTFLASSVTAQAQDQYLVYGYVFDEEGNVVPDAIVTVENRRTHEEVEVVSNGDGEYIFSALSFEEGYQDGDSLLLTAELGGEAGSVISEIVEGEDGERADITFGEMANVADDEDTDGRLLSPITWMIIVILIIVLIVGIIIYMSYKNSHGKVM